MKLPDDLPDRIIGLIQHPILPVLLILVLAAIVIRLARQSIHRLVQALLDREVSEGTAQELSAVEVAKRIGTLNALATNVIRVFVLLIAVVMILGELDLDIAPAIAGLGIVGIAVGFGAQSLVRDYFNGALILVENQFAIGDVIRIAGVSGVVEDFSLRRTTLRDLSGAVHTVPNGEIGVTSNLTRSWARINENVQVAYGTDLDRAIEVINDVGRAMREDPEWGSRVMEPPSVLRVNSLDESGVTLKVTGTVRASEQWAAAGELRRRLLSAFEAAGIEIPFPHRVIVTPASSTGDPGGSTTPHDADADRLGTAEAAGATDAIGD
jgi:moderate conductance mechanosensitive channel